MDQTNKSQSPVNNEVLETEDVQQPDGLANDVAFTGWRSIYGSIDLFYNPDKQPSIDPLEVGPQ